jgi:DNA-binding response OmpR family regulator
MSGIAANLSKKIVIITESHLLVDSIKDNLPDNNFLFVSNNWNESINSHNKIDLLITDFDDLKIKNIQYYRVKTIINLTNKSELSKDEINISKPFRLNSLLKIIEDVKNRQDIFCAINDNLIYHERLYTLNSPEKSIKLTAKENDIFKFLLLSPGFKVKKWLLLKNVWNYHKNSESSTVDTHLYKLKTKLPDGMLQLKDNSCELILSLNLFT